MRFEYDPNFVEQATFLSAKRDPVQECASHDVLDPLYRMTDVELRRRAFRAAHGDLFRRFGLDGLVPHAVDEFPLLAEHLNCCLVREAERTRAQSVDLYTRKSDSSNEVGEPTLIIALCPESLLDHQQLTPWLRRQLQHVEDMVNERFGYDTRLPAVSPVQQNLIRDRYAVLWDIYVEGRLIRSGKLDDSAIQQLWVSFSKAFRLDGQCPSRTTFERLLETNELTHTQMMFWATNLEVFSEIVEGENHARIQESNCCAVC